MSSALHLSRTMAIVNITPNSFSDGGNFFSYENFHRRLRELFDLHIGVIDIGAESTAPMNDPVEAQTEMERFERILFPFLLQEKWPSSVSLSIDTYKEETFAFVYEFIRKNSPETPLVWNDVSGLVNETFIDRLKNKFPFCSYVCGHTLVPSRDQLLRHKEFLFEGPTPLFFKDLLKHFEKVDSWFNQAGISDRVYFDPCFGLSKSREQNLYLLQYLSQLVSSFSKKQKWLIGISKKSFLRSMLPGNLGNLTELNFEQSERIHCYFLAQWMQKLSSFELIYRTHDPYLPLMAGMLSENYPF